MTRDAVFVVDGTSTKQVFRASTWLLDRTTEVHWSSISPPPWKGVPTLFWDGPASRTNSFKIMIPFLSMCRNLTSLALTGIIVSGEHQHAVYSLPHLRKIILRSSRFQLTKVTMPKHNVTHLRLFNVLSEAAISHILRQISSTLTTLRIDKGPPKALSLYSPRCPRLTKFTYNSSRSEDREVSAFLERHPTIRVIYLSMGFYLPYLRPSTLPKVTKVTASGELGRFFLARPELTEFYQHPNDYAESVRGLWSWLVDAQRSQPHPPRLEQFRVKISHHSDDLGALPVISHFFGKSLCRLHIWVEGGHYWSSRSYSYLLDGWIRLKGPGPYSGNQAIVELVHLRSIQVSFGLIRGTEFPAETCKKLLGSSILPVCPALEEALFTAISSYESIEREKPEDGMELRIRKNGRSWDPPLQN